MNKYFANFLYIFLIVVVVTTCFFVIHYLTTDSTKCLAQPFVYGANKMGDVFCSCTQDKGSCPAKFSFNDTTFISKVTVCNSYENYSNNMEKILLENINP